MRRKLRIFSCIAVICLSICMFAFGVYAANQVSVTTSGTVSFTASGVFANVSRKIEGYNSEKSTNVKTSYSQNINSSVNEGYEFKDLIEETLTFKNPYDAIMMTFTFENLATEEGRYMYVTLDDVETEESVNIEKTAELIGGELRIAPGESRIVNIFI